MVGFLQPAVNANFPEKEKGGGGGGGGVLRHKEGEGRESRKERGKKRKGKKEGGRDVAANSFPPPLPQKPAAHFGQ